MTILKPFTFFFTILSLICFINYNVHAGNKLSNNIGNLNAGNLNAGNLNAGNLNAGNLSVGNLNAGNINSANTVNTKLLPQNINYENYIQPKSLLQLRNDSSNHSLGERSTKLLDSCLEKTNVS